MINWLSKKCFQFIHGNNLVYNTCWEDPRLDRQALDLKASDHLLVITSAGCNALDYLLAGASRVSAVDMNPRQNALLELKIAGIRALDFDTFFEMFGKGRLTDFQKIYETKLRPLLPGYAQVYWDRSIRFFAGRGWRSSFYFRGSSGVFARLVNSYIDRRSKLRPIVNNLLKTTDVQNQQRIFNTELRPVFWTRALRWAMNRDLTLALLGVPRAQRKQIEIYYSGGVVKFIEHAIDAVFGTLPLHDNYFYRVYLTGEYSHDCCPEYLKRENFERLKAGLWQQLSVHTSTVLDFLRSSQEPVSRFVLLDHMDWLSQEHRDLLQAEWQAIVEKATPDARVIWRSGGMQVDYVDGIQVEINGQKRALGEVLKYNHNLAAELHSQDRVHTYGSFYIADLQAA